MDIKIENVSETLFGVGNQSKRMTTQTLRSSELKLWWIYTNADSD